MILKPAGYGRRQAEPAVGCAFPGPNGRLPAILLGIFLGMHNGLRYIYRRYDRPVGLTGPCRKGRIMSIEQFIENEVKSNDVVLFMKGTPQFPQCGFSGQVVQILDHVGVGYKGLNVLESADLRNGIKTYSNWPTIPQLYVKGEFVGGCDIIREMFQAGELQQLLADKGVTINAPAN
jgi:monothiol glutaredoxin